MENEKKIKITIMGTEREFSLSQLIEIYKQIGDPNPESHAEESFRYHENIQNRSSRIEEAKKSPESLLRFINTEFSNDYDYNLGVFGGKVGKDVFELAAQLPTDMLESFIKKFNDETYKPVLQAILDRKKELQRNEANSENTQEDSER